MSNKVLVLGASGFLGSHVTKALVKQGRDVRILVRKTSDTRSIDHLDVERCIGDVMDKASLLAAMQGCATIFYCVVDTRAWLRDTRPLYRVNVDGLTNAMDAALEVGIERFVFTSSFVTVGLNATGVSTEADVFNWPDTAPDYILCRVKAEDKLMQYVRDKGLPAVACCVGNTYGAEDFAPTPHGKLVLDSACGKMPFYWEGGGPSVGIVDAAQALLQAEVHGRIGERYAISERWVSFKELFDLSAKAGGVKPPSLKLPIFVMYIMAGISEVITRLRGTENVMSVSSIKCSNKVNDVSGQKARDELQWQPQPIETSIEQAVAFYQRS
jgi:dihydroflavonol-4-reductase